MVYTRLNEPHTLKKKLPWPTPHMFLMLGILFFAQIIIGGWSTLALVSPTSSKTLPRRSPHMFATLGIVFCAQIIIDGWSILALVSPTPSKTLPWPSPHMFAMLGMVFGAQIIIDGWSTLALVSPTPSQQEYRGPIHTCSQFLAWLFLLKSILTHGVHSPW